MSVIIIVIQTISLSENKGGGRAESMQMQMRCREEKNGKRTRGRQQNALQGTATFGNGMVSTKGERSELVREQGDQI